MKKPTVSCIMPTFNRGHFLPLAISGFLRQTYTNLELIIVDSSTESNEDKISKLHNIKYVYARNAHSVGISRNIACRHAKSDIIVHLDDDDIYANDWVSRIVYELEASQTDICGLSDLNFYDLHTEKSWSYKHPNTECPWVYGATLAYKRSFWETQPFGDIQAGEDSEFLFRNNAKIKALNYTDGYLGLIHGANISMQAFDNPRYKIEVLKWIKSYKSFVFVPQSKVYDSIKNREKVSCIMPTANRAKYVSGAIKNFLLQNYTNKELIIIDDGVEDISHLIPIRKDIKFFKLPSKETIGSKRNFACYNALGEIIMHWDDDDWYAPDWITHQVEFLLTSQADICGLDQIQFYSVIDNKYWMTKNYNSRKLWLSGATLAYRKSFWEKYPFKDIQIGEDDAYVRNPEAKIQAHGYYQGFIALIHRKNTSIKVFQQ